MNVCGFEGNWQGLVESLETLYRANNFCTVPLDISDGVVRFEEVSDSTGQIFMEATNLLNSWRKNDRVTEEFQCAGSLLLDG